MSLMEEEKEGRKEQRRIDKWNQTHKLINNIDHKLCSICKEWFPAAREYFYNNSSNSIDGLHPYCIECSKNDSVQWRKENPDQLKVQYQKRNRRPKQIESKRIYSQRHRDEGKYKEWQKENPDRLKMYQEQHRNHDITNEQWITCKEYFNHECAYCGISELIHREFYKQDLHREHVYHNGANNLSNCVPACKNCNSSKGQHPLEEWYRKKDFFNIEKLNKIYKWLESNYLINRQ